MGSNQALEPDRRSAAPRRRGVAAGTVMVALSWPLAAAPPCDDFELEGLRPGMSIADARRVLAAPEDTVEVAASASGFETTVAFRRPAKVVALLFPGKVGARSKTGLVAVRTCVGSAGQSPAAFATQVRSLFGEPTSGKESLEAGLRGGVATWSDPACSVEVRAFRDARWWDPSADELCVEARVARPAAAPPVIRFVAAAKPEAPAAAPTTKPEPAREVALRETTLEVPARPLPAPPEPPPAAPVPALASPPPATPASSNGALDPSIEQARPTATAPRLLASTPPRYPSFPRERRIRANVVARVTILSDGSVGDVAVTKCDRPGYGFEDRVIAAVRTWRYAPATQSGVPVTAELLVPFTFE